jgi:hypothetical protein
MKTETGSGKLSSLKIVISSASPYFGTSLATGSETCRKKVYMHHNASSIYLSFTGCQIRIHNISIR